MKLTRTLAAGLGLGLAAGLVAPLGMAHAAPAAGRATAGTPQPAAGATQPVPGRAGEITVRGVATESATAAAAADPTATGGRRTVPRAAELQAALDQMVADEGAISTIARVEHGRATWRGTAGPARLGRPGPAPVNGRFRIGSVTKTFVATVVLQLVAEGRLRLNDPVQRRLPGMVPNGDRITLRHLLSHTSGLYNYSDALPTDIDGFIRNRMRTWTPAELVAIATAQPPLFEPGARWSYSNTNYILLGLVVERVTGRPYSAEVQRRILRPLGLRHTSLPGSFPRILGPHARSYVPTPEGPVDITLLNPTVGYAAGEMISTTADLNRFTAALLGGRLLPPAQLAEMTRSVPDADYGLGMQMITTSCGVTVYGHTGGLGTYGTFAFATRDGRKRLANSVVLWTGDFLPGLVALLNAAFCPAGTTPAYAGGPAPKVLVDHPASPRLVGTAGTRVGGGAA